MRKLVRLKRLNSKEAKLSCRNQAKWFLLVSDLLKVGFSLRHALTFTKASMGELAPFLAAVEQRMQEGETFAASLSPYIKTDLYYQLVLAERHGDLKKTLRELGQLLNARERQYKKLRELLQYPLILLMLLAVVITGLIMFVYPELHSWQQYSNGNSWLEIFKEVLIAAVTCLILISLCSYRRWQKQGRLKQVMTLCCLPIVGHCYKLYFGYYLTTNLATLLRHGLSLQEITNITATFDKKSLLYQFGQIISSEIERGGDLTAIISRYQFIPGELAIFINKGATLTELGEDLTAFANILFDDLIQASEKVLVWVQPLIFVVIAIIIVALYLSILLPIYHSISGVY